MKLKQVLIPRVVERFQAMADENRIRLLIRLEESPANVSTLQTELGIAQASVSKHLAVLRRAGLVDVQRMGTQSVYAIVDPSVFEICRIVCDGVARQLQRDQAVLQAINPEEFAHE